MKRIQGSYQSIITIQKSKFIAAAFRVDTTEEIEQILTTIKKKFYDANHHCYAYRLNDGAVQKMSDDGEPAKTAGSPILDVLVKQEITNILIVVTRYFGGTLLGTGGLVRAYSLAASNVLKEIPFYQVQNQVRLTLTVSYSSYQTILRVMKYIQIEKASFINEVIIEAHCKEELFDLITKDAYQYKIGDFSLKKIGVDPIETLIDTLSA